MPDSAHYSNYFSDLFFNVYGCFVCVYVCVPDVFGAQGGLRGC